MYKRDVKAAPKKVVEDGKINFGTYNTPFADLNMLDVPTPYIKEVSFAEKKQRLQQWQAFQVGDDRFYALMALSPASGYSEVKLYDKTTKKGYTLDSRDNPFAFEKTAYNLMDSVTEHKAPDGKYYRIDNLLKDNKIIFQAKSDNLNFYFKADFTGREPIVVLQPFSQNRPLYSHKQLGPGKGYVEIDGERIDFTKNAFMIVDDHIGYYPHRFWYDWITCAEYQDNKLVGIQLTHNQILNSYINNENCIWHSGKMYPLPNVYFYRNRDRYKQWFIKDDEGMVDLKFEPIHFNSGMEMGTPGSETFLDFFSPFGYLTGTVEVNDELTVSVDRVFGMGESKDGQFLPDTANIDN